MVSTKNNSSNIFLPNQETFRKAKDLFLSGEVLAFPTETVYGLGANALNENAVSRIFKLKNRPQDNPIISHVARKEQISEYANITNEIEQTIIDKLMPGPITILLPPKDMIPASITAGHPLMSIRIPSHTVALELLSICDFPVAAPSANISTKPSPTSAQMVYDNLGTSIPMIIDGGDCLVGIESTVVKVEKNQIIITRPGYITKEDLESVFDSGISVVYGQKPSAVTPGNRYKHYSPNAVVSLFSTIDELLEKLTRSNSTSIGIIATKEFLGKHENHISLPNISIFELGTESDMLSCAHNLFSIYHLCDKRGIKEIFIKSLPENGIGYAIMNRIKKSANF